MRRKFNDLKMHEHRDRLHREGSTSSEERSFIKEIGAAPFTGEPLVGNRNVTPSSMYRCLGSSGWGERTINMNIRGVRGILHLWYANLGWGGERRLVYGPSVKRRGCIGGGFVSRCEYLALPYSGALYETVGKGSPIRKETARGSEEG